MTIAVYGFSPKTISTIQTIDNIADMQPQLPPRRISIASAGDPDRRHLWGTAINNQHECRLSTTAAGC